MARTSSGDGQPLGFEAQLWKTADALRNNMDAAEYKHVVLGLIFLKYISDSFEEHREHLYEMTTDPASDYFADGEDSRALVLEDRDEYIAKNVFWVPVEARWQTLVDNAKRPTVGKTIDDAMVAIEKENPRLKGVLPKDYARPTLDWHRLGELVDLVGNIGVGGREARDHDILGRVYEYFLSQFASAEGKNAGQFYTPRSVVRLLVEMLEPYQGRVYDPCCGSGGMFVQSVKFVEAHGGKRNDVAVYGQESNPTTWRLAAMNLAIRGIEANLGAENADSFRRDLHPDLKADFVMANPPFNDDHWNGELLRDDVRWQFGVPPVSNANYAWVEHFVHHLAPQGVAGFVLANGSLSSQQSGEGDIRKALIEADLVDCVVALPTQLFYSTQIPVCLWFLARDRTKHQFRDRRGEILFIDARALGQMVDRKHRDLAESDIFRIARTYHAWRGETEIAGPYADQLGFCVAALSTDVASDGYVLTPGRYVGSAEASKDTQEPEERIRELADALEGELRVSAELQSSVMDALALIRRAHPV
jgi:type I restriction enzyme M protein